MTCARCNVPGPHGRDHVAVRGVPTLLPMTTTKTGKRWSAWITLPDGRRIGASNADPYLGRANAIGGARTRARDAYSEIPNA